MNQCETPVLLIVFNRPNETRIVIDAIRAISPKYLFIAQDGPRKNNKYDQNAVIAVRKVIDEQVNWPCVIKTLYQEENLGCGYGPAKAITWFFSNVDQGIILEDDCVPDTSFFRFCEELLEKYKNCNKVMHISGNNYQNGIKRGAYSYYVSKYTHNWGWATWARSWKYFDHELVSSSERSHVWDAAWEKSVRKVGGYGLLPQVNLVQNVGFGEHATHTKEKDSVMQTKYSIKFPLAHPPRLVWNLFADYYTFVHYFHHNLPALILHRIKKIFT